MNDIILLQNHELLAATIAPDAFILKTNALRCATVITEVTDEFSEQTAVDSLATLNDIAREVEKSRKEVKAPIIKKGKEIDSMAEEFCRDIEIQQNRLRKLLSTFEAEKRRIAAEAEAKRQEEIRAAEAEKRRIEEEQRREQDEANRKLMEAKTAEEARRIVQEQQTKTAVLEEKKVEAEIRQIETISTPAVRKVKAQGSKVADVPRFEVLNLEEVRKARPELVRSEPHTSAINNAIKNGMRECPGMRIWMEIDYNTR